MQQPSTSKGDGGSDVGRLTEKFRVAGSFGYLMPGRTYSFLDRDFVQAQLNLSHRGRLAPSVSKSVAFVVVAAGEEDTKVVKRAREMGVPVIEEEVFATVAPEWFPGLILHRDLVPEQKVGRVGPVSLSLTSLMQALNKVVAVPGSLLGEVVFPTGHFTYFKNKKEMGAYLEACGAVYAGHNVTGRVTLVVCGAAPSKKALERYRHLKGAAAKTLTEEDLVARVRAHAFRKAARPGRETTEEEEEERVADEGQKEGGGDSEEATRRNEAVVKHFERYCKKYFSRLERKLETRFRKESRKTALRMCGEIIHFLLSADERRTEEPERKRKRTEDVQPKCQNSQPDDVPPTTSIRKKKRNHRRQTVDEHEDGGFTFPPLLLDLPVREAAEEKKRDDIEKKKEEKKEKKKKEKKDKTKERESRRKGDEGVGPSAQQKGAVSPKPVTVSSPPPPPPKESTTVPSQAAAKSAAVSSKATVAGSSAPPTAITKTPAAPDATNPPVPSVTLPKAIALTPASSVSPPKATAKTSAAPEATTKPVPSAAPSKTTPKTSASISAADSPVVLGYLGLKRKAGKKK